MKGNWIWVQGGSDCENKVACFRKEFTVNSCEETVIRISADTRYVLYINGREIGRGPIRSTIERWYYDEYDISADIMTGRNLLAVRVWDYGWSTYQTIANKGGLSFEITESGVSVAVSDSSVLCTFDKGWISKTVKRNVNLGFMEHYNAADFSFDWMKNSFDDSDWKTAVSVLDNWGELTKRPVKYLDRKTVMAENIVSISETNRKGRVVSINAREALFPGRRDANATIMTAYIGACIEAEFDCKGTIEFPTNKWNGMHGDYKIDGVLYKIGKGDRRREVSLKKGKQFFIMELSAKFDDLFVHIEYDFDCKVEFKEFFTVGPVQFIPNETDGFRDIYGGLLDYDGSSSATESDRGIFDSTDVRDLADCGFPVNTVDEGYVFHDEYIYSLSRNMEKVSDIPVKAEHNNLLNGNNLTTVIEAPSKGTDSSIILDFNNMFVGNIGFTINAPGGQVMDIYCFENMFEGYIDFTFGLNNGIRYICSQGWQDYTSLTRMGLRFMMITFRDQKERIEIRGLRVNQGSYPVSMNGNFRCSDWKLNKIFEISKRTNLMCSEDTFADSPTYEQAFWSGDAQVSAAVSTFYFGEYDLLRHCLMQVPLGRKYTKLLPALMPTDWETAIPIWTMNWMISIEQYIFYTGDESIYNDLYDEVRITLDYYSNFISEEGAFDIKAWNMLDWAPMDIGNSGVVTAQQGLLAHCFEFGARMAQKLGFHDDVQNCTRKAEKLLEYLENHLWLEDKQAYADGWTKEEGFAKTLSMQTHVMLELYGLLRNKARRQIVLGKLLQGQEGWLEPGSPFMLFYLFEILHRNGYDIRILDEIRDRWGMMLRYDSSTCWEVFPGFYENSRTRSYCHSWSSAPGYVFIKYILGLVPIEQGFSKMSLSIPETDLEWCEGSIPTPYGKIYVYWSKTGNYKKFRAVVPIGIEISDETDGSWDITLERF
ncbi:MAG: alpha-L-rhamnosidase N-terminal domain-containing protein [Clostridia bacterium]|nr:alpha-L-rhamnosidase N-terminal domain-containing protein [Clostridia bacterium]MBN2883283.1 alpha-L-rhamnosidase N-terminal domain-containing protein [Clostridia bacterium]